MHLQEHNANNFTLFFHPYI